MTYYPIQASGVVAQYPLERARQWQAITSRTAGGYMERGLNPETRRVRWEVT